MHQKCSNPEKQQPEEERTMASIFSRIVGGEIPAVKVYEDDQTLAFMDINPAAKGHTLVICKAEHPSMLDVPPDLLANVAQTTQRVARAVKAALQADGFNIIQNDSKAAGQEVFHYHVHIIPRWEGDQAIKFWRPQSADTASLQALAEQIKAQL
jgi:histidine triad (HIT) family protein